MDQRAVITVVAVGIVYFILKQDAVPSYKLTYFNVPALGEPIRFLLSYGKYDFEDFRVEGKDWPNLKPSKPFGQVPTLEVDGKVAHQSLAICRYLAKKVNLVGNNDWEDLEIDAAADTINDFRLKMVAYVYEQDPEVSKRKKEQVHKDVVPFYIAKLEDQIKRNNGYLAAGKLTWADFYYASLVEFFNYMLGFDLTENAPNLKSLKQKVDSLPEIKAYLEKRPENKFSV